MGKVMQIAPGLKKHIREVRHMIIVGIDIASEKHDYFMLHKETGTVFSTSSVTIGNDEEGFKKQMDILKEYRNKILGGQHG